MTSGTGLFSKAIAKRASILRGGGIPAEVLDVREDVKEALLPLAPFVLSEFLDAPTAAPTALASGVTMAVAGVTLRTSQLGATALTQLATNPRNLTFTTAGTTAADAPTQATVVGSWNGNPQTETVTLAQTATMAAGTKPFSTITSIEFGPADGTNALVSVGFGASLGLAAKPYLLQTLPVVLREVVGATLAATAGTLTTEGLYTPSTAPNGTNDYSIVYLADGSSF